MQLQAAKDAWWYMYDIIGNYITLSQCTFTRPGHHEHKTHDAAEKLTLLAGNFLQINIFENINLRALALLMPILFLVFYEEQRK